jgi:hypothetical protein
MSNAILERVRSRLHPVQGLFRDGRFVARASCASCGAHEEWTSQKMPEPDVVQKKLEDRGWTLKRRPTCPSCQPNKETTVLPKPPETKIAVAAPSTDTRAALRLLSRVLDEEAYDHASQRYKPGFSDAGLAKDTGLSEKVVSSERERLCGPAGEPEIVTTTRLMFVEMLSGLAEMRLELSHAIGGFNKMAGKHGFDKIEVSEG